MPKIYTHYASPIAAINIQTSNELWGRRSGPTGIGGAKPVARAYLGFHEPSLVKPGARLAVEFTTHVQPTRSAIWFGAKTALWEDGTPGTKNILMPAGDTIVVPILVSGVF